MKNYMVDTNIINRILDHKLDLKIFNGSDNAFFATHVQRDEIAKTPDKARRDELLSIFQEITKSVSTESALWGKSNWDECKWAADDLVEKILEELDKEDKRKNNPEDELIADTAIKNNYILVTEDKPLYKVVNEIFKGSVQKLEEFLRSS